MKVDVDVEASGFHAGGCAMTVTVIHSRGAPFCRYQENLRTLFVLTGQWRDDGGEIVFL